MGWKTSQPASYSRTARYTEEDEPLPRPSAREFANKVAVQTISTHADLFQVPQVIRVDRLESLLRRHPNQPFVRSVLQGLREGFWPFMNTRHDEGYPLTHDDAFVTPASDRERDFISGQRDVEVQKSRFSATFGPDLLPGMYSTPVIAVPKPHSDDLRLVSHQSYGEFAQNTMVDGAQAKGPRLDTMQQFVPALLAFRRKHPSAKLVMWKSDVAEAFRLLPMHPLAQIKQVVTSNRNVDWCATFGNRGSPRLWASVMGLVIWVALFVKLLPDIFCYVDDSFGWELESNLLYYEPYEKYMPSKQVQLLLLWDFLGIPHKEKKQVHGTSLTVIGFHIDPNAMTITLPADSKAELEQWLQDFINTPSRRRTLREFLILAGWLNWAFNMYVLLRPALSNVYDKISGFTRMHAGVTINNAVKADLHWCLEHLQRSNGTLLLQALDWDPHEEAHATMYCDASLAGMGFWVPERLLGFYSPVPSEPPTDTIFFFEALCVASALRWYCTNILANTDASTRFRLAIFTDNQNTVNVFNTLRAKPAYNPILRTAVDDLIKYNVDLRVLHVAGDDNSVADAISRNNPLDAKRYAPGLVIRPFQPPQEPLGAASS
ncbi:hypothetical protein FB45DRAFT_743528 [Roridomyces roridus]|uniref:Uncharacterized protein n=1 Tax=Roridomyces roridus TaxID=1738132 RepID=A0AAD7BYU3_9AGAR|nr:hypothetical protein FB45DRAFT_743528 [Roridomyces roridus]